MLEKIIALSQIKNNEHFKDRNIYYEKVLTQIHNGKTISWNWAAALASCWWFLYRKQYLLGISLYISLAILAGICLSTIKIFMKPSLGYDSIWVNLSAVLLTNFIYMIIFGLFANKIYYNHLRKKVVLRYEPRVYTADYATPAYLGFALDKFLGVYILDFLITLGVVDFLSSGHKREISVMFVLATVGFLTLKDHLKSKKLLAQLKAGTLPPEDEEEATNEAES